MGQVLRAQGAYPAALAQLDTALQLNPNADVQRGFLGNVYALSGRQDEARRILAVLRQRPWTGSVGRGLAIVYLGLGERDRAMDALEAAFKDGPWGQPSLGVVDVWDPLRADPRFVALLKRLGLSP